MYNFFTKLLLIIGIILLFATLISPIYLGWKFGQLPSIPEYWLQYFTMFLSGTSFIAVIITLWLQFNESKNQQLQIEKNFELAQQGYDSRILDKIHFFMSPNMEECRSRCWILMTQISKDPQIKETLFSLFQKSVTNNWENANEEKETHKTEIFKNYAAFIKMARYFNLMSNYEYNELTANALQFYYIYYRKFFIELIELYNKAYDSTEEKDRIITNKENWIFIVQKFDHIMTKNNIPIN